VNETLLDLGTMEPTFERIFGEKSARLWFANFIMYSAALTVAGCYVPFTDIGYREVTVKGLDCQAVRALLVARAQIVSQTTTPRLENEETGFQVEQRNRSRKQERKIAALK
jgi:hypothetical protein